MENDLQFIVNFFQMEDNHNNFLMEDDQKISSHVDGGTSEP